MGGSEGVNGRAPLDPPTADTSPGRSRPIGVTLRVRTEAGRDPTGTVPRVSTREVSMADAQAGLRSRLAHVGWPGHGCHRDRTTKDTGSGRTNAGR
jgi:hypothetical protein